MSEFLRLSPSSFHVRRRLNAAKLRITLLRVIGDKNQISEEVFDFMISYLPFPQKSIRSELAKLFYISKFDKNMTEIPVGIFSVVISWLFSCLSVVSDTVRGKTVREPESAAKGRNSHYLNLLDSTKKARL